MKFYRILQSNSAKELAIDVSAALKDGWTLEGLLIVIADPSNDGSTLYVQVVTR